MQRLLLQQQLHTMCAHFKPTSPMSFVTGQRYINSADLQLGLGRVVAENHRMVKVAFDAVDEERIYAKDSAPLTRYVLNVGDAVRHKDGWEMLVAEVKELNGLKIYFGETADGQEEVLPETEIANTISLDRPAERLFNAQIDKQRWFKLRQQARKHQLRLQAADTYGLAGCRTALLPHQLYIAHAVGKRHAPRVLLADEVGLGKTIEAGLIVHQQMLSWACATYLDYGAGFFIAPMVGGAVTPVQSHFQRVR